MKLIFSRKSGKLRILYMERYGYGFVCPLDVGFLGDLNSILAIEQKPVETDPLVDVIAELKAAGLEPNPNAPNTF